MSELNNETIGRKLAYLKRELLKSMEYRYKYNLLKRMGAPDWYAIEHVNCDTHNSITSSYKASELAREWSGVAKYVNENLETVKYETFRDLMLLQSLMVVVDIEPYTSFTDEDVKDKKPTPEEFIEKYADDIRDIPICINGYNKEKDFIASVKMCAKLYGSEAVEHMEEDSIIDLTIALDRQAYKILDHQIHNHNAKKTVVNEAVK